MKELRTFFSSGLGLLLISLLVLAPMMAAQTYQGVLTWQYNNARTGQNPVESKLTLQNVNPSTFGRLFAFPVDGQIYAQPLYVLGVNIPGKGKHNVIYVATENDSLYALDADGLALSPLWYRSYIDPAHGITPVPCADNAPSCNVWPILGISGTPVIDPKSGIMYFITQTKENGQYFQRLHAVDITTGAEMQGGPVVISGSVPGRGAGSVGGRIYFDSQHTHQRIGLLLANGNV